MSLDIRTASFGSPPLVRDYLDGAADLAPFFAGGPADAAAYRRKLEEVDRRMGADGRARAVEALRPTSPRAADALARLVEEGGVFVTTGQQAGLFGGPLYTVYKALTAVRLARALEPVLERPVVPLFWVASDDHDWAEVRHTRVLDTDNRVVRIELPADEAAPQPPMSRRLLGAGVRNALDQLERALPPSDFVPALMETLRRAYAPERTVAAAFADLLADLFAPFDLVLVDAADPRLKTLSRDTVRHELAAAEAHEAVLARGTESLQQRGYHAQVPILPGATNVFLDAEQGRERLVREDGQFHLRGSGRAYGAEELVALLEAEPERFSPNVLLRPVAESAALPTVAYVAGPGEISYWAQIGCLFQRHGIAPPIVFPRFSVLLLEAKVAKVLEKFGLDAEDCAKPAHELAARVLRDELPPEVSEAVRELRRSAGEGYARLEAAARVIDPTLKGPIGSARGAAFHELEQVEKKIVSHLKLKRDVELEQLRKAAANLYPEGVPQERALSPIHYLARYGTGLLERLADAMDIRLEAERPGWRGVECE